MKFGYPLLYLVVISLLFLNIAAETANRREANRELVNINGDLYFISSVEGDIQVATQQCNDIGMKLISIQSENKQLAITDYLDNNGYGPLTFWTSGYRLYKTVFMWGGTGQLFNYTNWRVSSSEPDEPLTSPDTCVILATVSAKHEWHDILCSANHFFICEQFDKF